MGVLEALDVPPEEQHVADRDENALCRRGDVEPLCFSQRADALQMCRLRPGPAAAKYRQDVDWLELHQSTGPCLAAFDGWNARDEFQAPRVGPAGDIRDGAAPACGSFVDSIEYAFW